jgi:hypothetical protein
LNFVSLSLVVLGECAAVYKNNPHTTEEQEILAAVISVSKETLAALADAWNFQFQLQLVLETDGAYTENVFM